MTVQTTHSDPPAGRKPRRLGLWLPWGLAIVLAVGWSIAWLWMANEAGRRLDAAAASMRGSGWQVAWTRRDVGGYPFRLDVDLTGVSVTDPTGWGVSAPQIKSEAFAFEPTHWLFAVPNGLSFTRPDGGAVVVTAKLLRFSINSWDQHPPRLSLEGDDLVLTPAPGAKPFWLTRAHVLLFDTRAGPDDQGASYFSIDGGAADPASWVGQAAQGQPVSVVAETSFNHAGAVSGRGWGDALLRWAHAGGRLDIDQFTLTAGGAGLESKHGDVSVGDDGRLTGGMDVTLKAPAQIFPGLPVSTPAVHLDFHDGATWVGRLKLSPAPRAF
jgi:hypothetical protein